MTISSLPAMNVSRETTDKLVAFAQLVEKWTKSINLIAPKTVEDIWNRHILDSAQVFDNAPNSWNNWVDLGSGGGFPGVIIAIMDDQQRPVTLVESDTRKSLFLKTAKRELDLNLTIINARIEKADLPTFDVVSARAFAPLNSLLGYTQDTLQSEGTGLFPKGQNYQQELADAKKTWHFDYEAVASTTQADARLLKVSRISPRER